MVAQPTVTWFTVPAIANLTVPNRPAVATALKSAMTTHRAGNLEAAEADYRRVLAAQPENANANHLLGSILSESERAKKEAEAS